MAGVVFEAEIDMTGVHRCVEAETVAELLCDVVGRDAVPAAGDMGNAGAQDRVEDRRADLAYAAAGFLRVGLVLNGVRQRPSLLFGAVAGLFVEAEGLARRHLRDLHHTDRF